MTAFKFKKGLCGGVGVGWGEGLEEKHICTAFALFVIGNLNLI